MKINATKRVLALLLTLAMLLPNFIGAVPGVSAETVTAEANVYDIYDLTGAVSNTIKGTDETWDGQIHADVSEEHKENIVFKTRLTMGEQQVRLSINALEGANIYDPAGYAVYINHNDGAPYIAIKRNQQDLVVGSVPAVSGTWELEIGIVDILTDGERTGKYLYVKKDGEIVCEAEDTDGYLTGDTLGTKIIDFHYGASIQMDSTYKSCGEPTVYDIYDLTGAVSNTILGTDGTWDGQIHANISDEHKENFAFKTKLTMETQNVRLSLTAQDGDSHYDPVGYAVYLYGAENKIELRRNNSALASETVDSLAGTYVFEVGIVDISFNGERTGKYLYVKINDAVVCEYDDVDGYLTGDTLGTEIIDFHYGASIQMDSTYESSHGEPTVYDIYDLTGAVSNTILGTDGTWDGQIHANISDEHKENFAFKTKLTMETQNIRLSLTAQDGDSHYDPVGYAVYLYGEENRVELRRNNSALTSATVDSLAGTYVFEVGIVDILFNGERTGKHLYVKINDEVVCEYDDVDGYLTGDTLGTKIIDFHYGASIQMDSTYEISHGEPTIYDIYDLTGAVSNTILGTDDTWEGQIHANISDEHKENFAFKTKLTMATQNVRLSLTAQDGDSHYDPVGYAVYLYGEENRVELRRNNSALTSATVDSLAGTYVFEVGIVDILFNGERTGKYLYVKINDAVVCEYDDVDGYLTGDTLGTEIIDFHYGASIQMDSTYEIVEPETTEPETTEPETTEPETTEPETTEQEAVRTYAEATVYDLYDLAGVLSKTIDGRIQTGTWDQQIGTVADEHKGNVAFTAKMNVGSEYEHIFIGLSMTGNSASSTTNGYIFEIQAKAGEADAVVYHKKDAAWQSSSQNLTFDFNGSYVLEAGIVDIMDDGVVVGKRAYLKGDGEMICYWDDMSPLTADDLGTVVGIYNEQNDITIESTYDSGYGEVNVYDIYKLTGVSENTVDGTGNDNWATTVLGNIDISHKENVSWKANVSITDEATYRFSLGALDSDDCVDPAGYGFELVLGASGRVTFIRGSSHTWIANWGEDTTKFAGEYELEFGYRDILFNGEAIGKQIFLKKDGEVLYSYDDLSGYLTGDALGTKVAVFHYGSAIELDSTVPSFVNSYNLTLGGSTVMNLRLDTAIIADDNATVTLSAGGTETSWSIKDLPVDAQGLRVVSAKLAAAQMKDDVIVTVVLSDGTTMSKSYTVAGYSQFILNGESYAAEQKAVVEAMLHYGAAAQKYFGYNAEKLADEGYTDEVTNVIGSNFAPVYTGAVEGVSHYGSSILMVENISLRHYLNISGDVSAYSFAFNGEEVTPVAVSTIAGTNYYVQYDGILPNELDGVYELTVSDGTSSFVLNYSPMSYIQRMSTKDSIKDLVQQLYDYHLAAKELAASKVVDEATVLDLYQLSGQTSITVPDDQVMQVGVLVGAQDSFLEKELNSNVAIRFKYTGNEGMRFQIGASTSEISSASGVLFLSVPANNSFGIADISDNGTWQQDAAGNDIFSWQECLGEAQTSYIELGVVRRYTEGVYTHDRIYVRAAATLAELDAMAQAGTFSVYYDTTMKDNLGYNVILRERMSGDGDILETTWTDAQITAYNERVNAIAQGVTSGNYDALEEKYEGLVDENSNTAASAATATNPTGNTTATGGDELILWAESGTAKIVQDDDGKAASLASSKATLSIQMAKNEDEGAQLMLFGNRNVEGYEIFVTDLTSGSNVISADNIRLYQLKYLTIDDKNSGDYYDTPSQYEGEKLPDAMLPFAKAVEYGENVLVAGNNQAIFVDVSTDANDVAGVYTGTIVVKTNTDQIYTLPISVTVQDVVLSDTSNLGTYAPVMDRDTFSTGEMDGSDEMSALYIDALQQFNMSAINPIPNSVQNLEKFLVSVRQNYDQVTNYLIPVDNSDSYYDVDGTKTLVYCNYTLLKEYVVALAQMSIADGVNYLEKAFFYPSDHADEPNTEDEFNVAKATYQAFCQMLDDANAELTALYNGTSLYTAELAESVKTLRFLLTIPSGDDNGKTLDVDVLLTDFLETADRKNVILSTTNDVLVREGYSDNLADAMNGAYADELWTYLCLSPYTPYSNYAFDTPVVGLRVLGWTCYQENVDTLMTWSSVNYLYGAGGQSLDRWTTSSAGIDSVTPGDGNIFYPGAKYGIDGPCPSLRAVAWRDGVDDYNLMYAVVENGGAADSLNSLYGMITESYTDTIKKSSETGSWLGSLFSTTVDATVPIDDDAKFSIVRNALLQMAASEASEHSAIISNAQSAVNAVVTASGTVTALEEAVSEIVSSISGNIYNSTYYQLADFESYAETIVNKFSGNAQLALVDNAQNGSCSLEVAVQPGEKGQSIWIPTTSKYFSATTDFSGASKITFKVYNAQSTDSTVRFYLNTYDRSGDVYNLGTYYKSDSDVWHDDLDANTALRFTLAPGWNEITVNAADISVDMSYVGALIIAFESGEGFDAEQVFCLDDVRVYMDKVS